MPRPSRQIDQVLLASGRALFPSAGAAGLSVRAVAEHAGVNPAMFHYHFKNKAAFLDALLQQLYEEMFSALNEQAHSEGPALLRLEHALRRVARMVREHRRVLARVWMDALSGEPVALAFFRRNAPRHVGLLSALLEEAQRDGELAPIAPVQRFVFLMGSVLLPMIFAAELVSFTPELKPLRVVFDAQVLSDEAIDERVALALGALRASTADSPSRSARAATTSTAPGKARRATAARSTRRRTAA